MIICPWCGQQSQSEEVCDWCKRPMEKAPGPPAGTRSELDFLREESEVNRFGAVKAAAVVVGAIACGVMLFLLFKPQAAPVEAQGGEPPSSRQSRPTKPTTPPVNFPPGTTVIQLSAKPPSFWVRTFDNTTDLISNARWTQQSPGARTSVDLKMETYRSSAVRLQDVNMTIVSLGKGIKRAAGKAVIVNNTERNVIFYRFELIWGMEEILMFPLVGTRSRMEPLYAREIKPGGKASVQFVSRKITEDLDGSPTAVRLWAWLDGGPDSSVDDFQIQLGR